MVLARIEFVTERKGKPSGCVALHLTDDNGRAVELDVLVLLEEIIA